jgi:hypothetical protein
MTAAPRLDTGFFVGTENVILGSQPLALPEPCIQVEDRSGLLGKLGIPGKDPIAVVPGFNRILAQNAPDGAATHRFAQDALHPCGDIAQGLTAERLLGIRHQLTGHSFHPGVIQRGKNLPCVPGPAGLAGNPRLRPNAYATAGLAVQKAPRASQLPRPPGRSPDAAARPTETVGPAGVRLSCTEPRVGLPATRLLEMPENICGQVQAYAPSFPSTRYGFSPCREIVRYRLYPGHRL